MNEARFKELFMPFYPKLFRIAFALIGNAKDAEDVLQEAYCKLWDKRGELLIVRNCEAFSVSLTRNLCLDFLRSKAYRVKQTGSALSTDVAGGFSPEDELIEQDRMGLVAMLIRRLPENQRQVLRLWSIEGCSAEEITAITGLSAVNIRVLLSRARKTVREKMDKISSYER